MEMVEVKDDNIITYSKQYLRKTTFEKLVRIAKKAPTKLVLLEGYRSIEKQTKMFNDFKKENPHMSDLEVHQFIAIPSKAVHVTGGAVDVTLLNYDMGTDYLCFNGRQATEYYINDEVSKNRKLLLDLMASEEFVNFSNEWWHFEYGCSLWAKKYNNGKSIFEAVKEIKENE